MRRAFFFRVGMARFELATSRPPDVHSNRTELHPDGGHYWIRTSDLCPVKAAL